MSKKKGAVKNGAIKRKKLSGKQIRKFLSTLDRSHPTMIEVEWLDAFSKKGWNTWDDLIKSEMRIWTVGYFLSSSADYVHLAQGIKDVDDVGRRDFTDYWGIPLGMVWSIRRV